MDSRYIVDLSELSARDTNRVGGKNASLGEMIRNVQSVGVNVPPGFATTAEAYWDFLDANGLRAGIESALGDRPTGAALSRASKTIRRLFAQAQFPPELATAIVDAYRDLSAKLQRDQVHVAVRSSATAEDLPSASFAGQQETFLNVTGEEALLEACRDCFASLFADRAIAYREAHGFEHLKVALSIGVQQMVRSDKAGAACCSPSTPKQASPTRCSSTRLGVWARTSFAAPSSPTSMSCSSRCSIDLSSARSWGRPLARSSTSWCMPTAQLRGMWRQPGQSAARSCSVTPKS